MATATSPVAAGTGKLNVGVCIGDPSLRERVCSTLEAGGHHIFARKAGIDALLASCNGSSPASVVVEVESPSNSALDGIEELREMLAEVRLVAICERASRNEVRRAIERGVDGLVLTDQLDDALAAVVTAACAGQVSVPGEQRTGVGVAVLTTREKQILGLVVMGMSNAEIAGKLFLAESTIKSHLSSAFSKLGVSSRSEAASVILDPQSGAGLGILTIPTD